MLHNYKWEVQIGSVFLRLVQNVVLPNETKTEDHVGKNRDSCDTWETKTLVVEYSFAWQSTAHRIHGRVAASGMGHIYGSWQGKMNAVHKLLNMDSGLCSKLTVPVPIHAKSYSSSRCI